MCACCCPCVGTRMDSFVGECVRMPVSVCVRV